jgi:hypothetical protein
LTEPDERRQFYLNEDAFCLRFGLDKSAHGRPSRTVTTSG